MPSPVPQTLRQGTSEVDDGLMILIAGIIAGSAGTLFWIGVLWLVSHVM